MYPAYFFMSIVVLTHGGTQILYGNREKADSLISNGVFIISMIKVLFALRNFGLT